MLLSPSARSSWWYTCNIENMKGVALGWVSWSFAKHPSLRAWSLLGNGWLRSSRLSVHIDDIFLKAACFRLSFYNHCTLVSWSLASNVVVCCRRIWDPSIVLLDLLSISALIMSFSPGTNPDLFRIIVTEMGPLLQHRQQRDLWSFVPTGFWNKFIFHD